jgi:hypothetical protein
VAQLYGTLYTSPRACDSTGGWDRRRWFRGQLPLRLALL